MLPSSRRAAWLASAAVALAAGATVAVRAAPLGPWLTWDFFVLSERPDAQIVELRVHPRGGEPETKVDVEVISGNARLVRGPSSVGVGGGQAARFVFEIARASPEDVRLRLRQTTVAGGERTYEVPVARDPR